MDDTAMASARRGPTTSSGVVEAGQVVVATGFDHEPFIPDWPGREEWLGDLAHSSQYRNPLPYNGNGS
jgi:cation diffusion facilitator CzcD-associated flavoprotein CzcO